MYICIHGYLRINVRLAAKEDAPSILCKERISCMYSVRIAYIPNESLYPFHTFQVRHWDFLFPLEHLCPLLSSFAKTPASPQESMLLLLPAMDVTRVSWPMQPQVEGCKKWSYFLPKSIKLAVSKSVFLWCTKTGPWRQMQLENRLWNVCAHGVNFHFQSLPVHVLELPFAHSLIFFCVQHKASPILMGSSLLAYSPGHPAPPWPSSSCSAHQEPEKHTDFVL